MISSEDLITIGVIQKPRGVKGELKVLPTTDRPERFSLLKRVFLTSPDGERRKAFVEQVRYAQGSVFLQLESYHTPEAVAAFRQWEIQIPRDEALPLSEGEYYVFDLIGLEVQTTRGDVIGHVSDVQLITGNDLLQVQSPEGREYLIPFVEEFVKEVDVPQGKITIEPLEGLLD
jgi:16S rRNA processing protein RimM